MTWQLNLNPLDSWVRWHIITLSLYPLPVPACSSAVRRHIFQLPATTIFQRLFEYSFSAAKRCFLAARKASLHKLCSKCLTLELYVPDWLYVGAMEREKLSRA